MTKKSEGEIITEKEMMQRAIGFELGVKMNNDEITFLKRIIDECNVGERRVLLSSEITNVLKAVYRQITQKKDAEMDILKGKLRQKEENLLKFLIYMKRDTRGNLRKEIEQKIEELKNG